MLASSEQIRTEELVEGQHVKVYVVEVRRSTRGPHPNSTLSTGMFTTPPRSTRPYLARASSMLIWVPGFSTSSTISFYPGADHRL